MLKAHAVEDWRLQEWLRDFGCVENARGVRYNGFGDHARERRFRRKQPREFDYVCLHHDLTLERYGRTRRCGRSRCCDLCGLHWIGSVIIGLSSLRQRFGYDFACFYGFEIFDFDVGQWWGTDRLARACDVTVEVEAHGELSGELALVLRAIGIEAGSDLVLPGFVLLRFDGFEIGTRFNHESGFPELQNIVVRTEVAESLRTDGRSISASQRCGAAQ